MQQQNVLVGLVIVVALGVGVYFAKDSNITVNSPVSVESPAGQSFGAVPGGDFYNPVQFFSGFTEGTILSTTTPASMTLAAKDVRDVGSVIMFPSVGAITVTFPASSTLPNFLPVAGQRARQCWYNATTTAGINITFASGTGVDLEIASTTVLTGATSLVLNADNSACFEFQRKGGAGSSSRDFTARFLRFSDGD